MLKKLFLTMLLAYMPVASSADANITKSPFANDPVFQDFQRLQAEMNKIFEDFNKQFFSDIKMPQIPLDIDSGFSMSVKTDVVDKGDYYEIKIKADLPGVEKSAIKVNVKDNILSIEAKTQKSKEEKGDKVIKQERFVGSFYRAMSLPSDANPEKMTTEYKDGVLTIKIPKKK